MSTATAFVPSAARTVNGNSNPLPIPANVDNIGFLIDVTAFAGTSPTLTLSVQWSNNGTTWADADPADAFAVISAAKVVAKMAAVKAAQARLAWTIGGTGGPSFTFSADARWADHSV